MLAVCPHPALVAARETGRKAILTAVKQAGEQADATHSSITLWQGAIVDSTVPVTVAGIVPYGQLPTTWLEKWWTEALVPTIQHWRKGVAALRSLAITTVEACRNTWLAYLTATYPRPNRQPKSAITHSQGEFFFF